VKLSSLTSLSRQLAPVLLIGLTARLAQMLWKRRPGAEANQALPSLYQAHPDAARTVRRPQGVQTVSLEDIAGTTRKPSQNTADFRPLPHLRGQNWQGRWQRINAALHRLDNLPPVDLVHYADRFWVEDGHNRVAAAKQAGGVAIDADVQELVRPGQATLRKGARSLSGSLSGGEDLRAAGEGRFSRTAERRVTTDTISRHDLLRQSDETNESQRMQNEHRQTVSAGE